MGASLNLHHAVQRRGGRETLRVDHLAVEAGEHVSVLGPNGAGKTTLLRLIAGVDAPASGSVTIDGSSLTSGGVETRRRIAYASQQPGLLSTSVRRNVELPLAWRKVPRHVRTALAMESLERLRVAHLADRAARALSGGEQQRVNLARALALEPAVLLLDEPAAGLDAPSRAAFFADLDRALADRAITVIQVSHRAEEAMPFADRVVVLHEGRVHQVGTPDALSLRPADATVATLVGYENLIDATALPDGTVTVDGHRTGLDQAGASGPATIAAFAPGVHAADANSPGIPARVVRVASGPGHRIVTLDGPASVIAHLPLGQPAPMVGDDVRLTFDPASCVVIDTAAPATNREGTSDEHHGRMAHHRQA